MFCQPFGCVRADIALLELAEQKCRFVDLHEFIDDCTAWVWGLNITCILHLQTVQASYFRPPGRQRQYSLVSKVMCHLIGIHYKDLIWLLLQNGQYLNRIWVTISVSKRTSNVQYCLGTWVHNNLNPGSDMLPSHMKLIMILVTLFNYPKLPLKFLFRVMRLEAVLNP